MPNKKNEDILKRWTEYCSELYNYRSTGDPEVLNIPPATNNANHPILHEEVEAAVKSLKSRKSAGVDNIPEELLQQGGEAMVNDLLLICNNIWWTGEWPTLDPVSSHHRPKERQFTAMPELPHHQSH